MFKLNDSVCVTRMIKDENGVTIREGTTGKVIRGYSMQPNCYVVKFGCRMAHCSRGVIKKI